jgi:hypothetical protein
VTETISVEAQTAAIQTDSSEKSAELSNTQLNTLTTRGREVVSLLRTIPGVQYQADQDSMGGSYTTGTPSSAGTSKNTNTLAAVALLISSCRESTGTTRRRPCPPGTAPGPMPP